ncbi:MULTISPECIES: ABC transporter substrate-binding protein [Sutcliffiella]|uniref:ABC transporter substrate-binding protein n=1 Tax=Sutcliffiella cohnii TaxID=33932 RepID=A0A223KMZ4_9BACI|nr:MULTISPECIES: ABC transporter substrate-binding protein [Sutcliffiella]AST90766.1 hypothetical protein BC6307_05450 [Sutcliffiella cohnii]MED4017944.1 ABC transporter substrate-binding protein [Sutcliffiella cohnii]WBL16555.1 ABC transporter substrate-binding protein [Sutcliffiella sp. NC1]
MKERYFTLRAHLNHFFKEKEYDLKLEDIDRIWYCSRKNTKRILHRLENANLIAYHPGRGRGNVSKIVYYTSFQNEVQTYIEDCVNNGTLDKIAEILRLPIPKSWVDSYSKDIRELLGLRRDYGESRDILHTFKARDIESLDPLKISLSLETHLIEYLGDTLVRYDKEKDCFIPHIAHHFHVDSFKKIWTFYLRKGVFFHNQDYVTSSDVAHTIDRMKNSSPSYSWLARNIVKVTCPHPQKIEIHLDEPNPFFLRYLSAINFCILPANVEFDEYVWIGTGPFKMKERSENKLILEANDYYFKERPLIDEIHFYRVSSEAAKTIYLSGEEDPTNVIPAKHTITNAGVQLLSFNLKRQNIIRQHAFREAIFHLFDVQKMADDFGIEIHEASSIDIERSRRQEKFPNKIPALLEQSGYQGESLNLYCFRHNHAVKEATWLKKEAEKYGVQLIICTISYTQFSQAGIEENIDLLMMGLSLSFDKHLAFSYALKNQVLLFNRLFNQEVELYVEEKLRQFELEEEKEKRIELMDEIEKYLQKEYAFFFLHHPIVTRFLDRTIENVQSHSFGQIDYTKIWIPS